jgi:hypothetical protein
MKYLKKIKTVYYLNDVFKFFFYNLKYSFTKNNNLQFIIVPRSGTTLIDNIIDFFKLEIDYDNHYVKPKYNLKRNYIISIRDPIERFVSAFYHTKSNQKITFYKKFFETYPDVNSLANDLPSNKAISHIRFTHVLNEGLATFLSIDDIKKNNPKFIFDYSSLHDDIKVFLEKKLPHKKNEIDKLLNTTFGETNKGHLNDGGLQNLKEFLKKDIEVYDYLKMMKKTTNLKLNV